MILGYYEISLKRTMLIWNGHKCLSKGTSVAGLAQSVEHLTAEQEIVGLIPWAGPLLSWVLK